MYEIYENGLNNLHVDLSSLGQASAENDGYMRRVLTTLETRVTRLEQRSEMRMPLDPKKPPL